MLTQRLSSLGTTPALFFSPPASQKFDRISLSGLRFQRCSDALSIRLHLVEVKVKFVIDGPLRASKVGHLFFVNSTKQFDDPLGRFLRSLTAGVQEDQDLP